MTREEARKLLSGYATGSLTELERQLLFDAALDDQELFDELAEEQVLKEIIDLPGAKDRLITALTPEPQPKRSFAWWPLATGAAALAIATLTVWVTQRPAPEEPAQLAQNVEQPKTEQSKEAPAPAARTFDQQAVERTVVPPKPAAPEPIPAQTPPAAEAPAAEKTLADNLTPTETAAVPAQLEARARQSLPILGIGAAGPSAAQAKPALAAQAFVVAGAPATSVASGVGLTYEVRPTGILRITPIRPGVLEVTFDGRSLFPTNPVIPGTPIDISVPLEAKELRIDFGAAINAPAPAAVQSQESTGTLTLPSGPSPRAIILIPAQR